MIWRVIRKTAYFPVSYCNEVQRVVKENAKALFIVGYRFSPEEPETPGITMSDTLVLIDE